MMPRFRDLLPDLDAQGQLIVEARSDTRIEVFYTLSPERLGLWKRFHSDELRCTGHVPPARRKLLEVDAENHLITTHPANTRAAQRELMLDKYRQVERIVVKDKGLAGVGNIPSNQEEVMMLLEDLPSCFVKDFDYGLGLAQHFNCIVEAVEQLSRCTEIFITDIDDEASTGIEGTTFRIAIDDLEAMRKAINRTASNAQAAARSVKYGATHNFLAAKLGKPGVPISTGRSPLRREITSLLMGEEAPLTASEQDALLTLVTRNTESIAKAKSVELARLKGDIELVTLDNLIERFERMIGKRLQESSWQSFLDENPFVLSLAFGYPILKVCGRASVGGRRLSGSGDKIADFLVKNSMTNNAAIVEIKRPDTRLLGRTQVRGGVHAPSTELVGAVNQTLDQKSRFEQEIAQIKANSRMYDLESYLIHCCLIVGKMRGLYTTLSRAGFR